MGLKVTNNAFGTLNAGINSSATTIVLTAGQGARFPTLSAGDYFYATLIDTSNNLEIVKVTARSTDTMTVVRGQDNTTARAYSTNDRFELRPTAALFNEKANTADVAATYVELAGDTMTGDLGVGAAPSARLHATKAGAEVARFTNSQTNGGDWEFKIGGGGFENRKLMITDKFSGADNVRLSVDDGGRVRMPNQPAFRAYHSGNIMWNSGALSPVVYNTAVFNIGNHYNTSTGIFTAPIAGTYLFSVFEMFMDEPSYLYIFAAIQINGGSTTEFMRNGVKGAYDTFGGTVLVSLAANDQVRVTIGLASVDAGYIRGSVEMNSFMGYLVG
jgi:hypothetical protein